MNRARARMARPALLMAVTAGLVGCVSSPAREARVAQSRAAAGSAVLIAHLGRPGGDCEAARAIRDALGGHNPGYDLALYDDAQHVPAASAHRVVFVQEPTAGRRTISARANDIASEIGGGDIVLLEPGWALSPYNRDASAGPVVK